MDAMVENKALPVLRSAIWRLLTPLVKILLRHGVPYQVFADEAKKVFLDVADAEFALSGRKQSSARVAIITGMSRKEISRMRKKDLDDEQATRDSHNRSARVISAWVGNPEFQAAPGKPMDLPIDGASPSFTDLVRKHSGDMLVRAMLDELVRVGAVEVVDRHVRLINRAYIPANSEVEKLRILGTDVAALIDTINHNLQSRDAPLFQRKVYYDNLPEDALQELRALSRQHGQQLIELMDRLMQAYDRDVNPQIQGEGRCMAGIGVYYFEKTSSMERSQ